MASQPIFQLYAELNDYAPKMWRRFQVPNNVTMARLGYIMMTLFEMQASHLFCFHVPVAENFRAYMEDRFTPEDYEKYWDDDLSIFDGKESWRYEISDEDMSDFGSDEDEKVLDATQEKMKDVLSFAGARMVFHYDYGDDWHVALTLEEIIVDKELPGKELPRVLEGAGYGIVEDCGGTPGLTEIATAFKKKKGNAYKEFREWLDLDDLDLNRFDIEDMNFRLKKVPRIYADIYEYELMPTQRSIDLLERKYLERHKEAGK